MFWGLFLILVGFALIIKYVFNLDIPVMRIAVALFLIMVGIRLLMKNRDFFWDKHDKNDVIFREASFDGKDMNDKEYNVIFGSSVIDLRDLDSTDLPKTLKINTIFGSSIVKLNKNLPVKLVGDAVFAGAKLPDGNTTAFGEVTYNSPSLEPDVDKLTLQADVVFGSLQVRTY